MKKILIGVIVLLVVLVAAAVIGPNFINWNDYKAQIITAVRDATGRELAIDGDISLALLPAPALSARNVRLASLPGATAVDMLTLKALEVRVALAPLISGDIQVTSVRLIEPQLILEVLPEGQTNWQFQTNNGSTIAAESRENAPGPALSLDKLAIEDALLIYRDGRTGAEERVEHINLDGSAASLQGPFQFTGNATVRNLRLGFVLSVDGITSGKPIGVRLNLKVAGVKAVAGFTGRIEEPETAPRLSGQLKFSSPNVAALQNAVMKGTQASAFLKQPLQLKASVNASAKAATLNDVDLTFGPVQASGAVIASFGEDPSYNLALAIGHLDLDKLLEGTADTNQPSAEKGRERTAAETGGSLPAIPKSLRGNVLVTVEGLRYRGDIVSQVQLDASVENGTLRLEKLSALLPGGSDLRFSGGARAVDGGPRFDGKVELASNNFRGLLSWFDANPATIPANRLATMVLTSNFSVTRQQAQISDMNLRMDNTTIEGAATILLQARPSFGLALNIDRINLDGYIPKPVAAGKSAVSDARDTKPNGQTARKGTDSPLAILEEFDSNLILNIGELTYNAAPIRGLSAELGLAAGKLTVRRAAVLDFYGANLSFRGSGQGFARKPTGKAKLRIRAKYIDGLARLAGLELPVPPKHLTGLTLDGLIDGDADHLNFDIKTTLAGLSGSANGAASDLLGKPKANLKLKLSHKSLAAFSRIFDLGIKPLPRANTPISLHGTVKGDSRALALDLVANLAGGEVTAKGVVEALDKETRIDLTAGVTHKDLVSLLAALGNQFEVKRKSPGGVNLATRIQGGGNAFELNDVKGQIGGITLTGKAGLRLDAPRPILTANLQAGDIVIDHFLGAASGESGGKAGQSQEKSGPGDGRWSREAIDLSALQALDANISLAAKRLEFGRYPFEEPRLHLTITDGVLRVKDLSGRLFKGSVGLRATLNSRPLPGLDLSVQLQGADINQAMRTALQMDQVTGQLNFTGQFHTTGSSQWDMVNALSGKAKIHAEKGVFRGFDMKNFSERLGRLNKAPDFLNLAQRAFSGGKTHYQSVDGDWIIKNGVARTQNTQARMDASQANVTGTVHLPAWKMDLRAVMALTEHRDAPDMGVHLFGPVDRPRYDLKTAKLERWLLARLGRELLGKNPKGLGKLLEAVMGGGGSQSGSGAAQPLQPAERQPRRPTDPSQQLLEGLFKALKKK